MRQIDLVIIGGGAAGMAAAVSARKNGIADILIIERNNYLGGVLHQCIHNGFGLHRFKEDLTGVEFARKYRKMVEEEQIPFMLGSFVIEMTPDHILTVVNPEEGLVQIQARAVILAMGCRERTRNNLLIPGTRGAGILTAGCAQRYLNINGYLPGSKVVILGSGDIGLIMARQFVLEGASVEAVVEVMPYSSGLPRNMKQCIEDFDIPVYFSSTVSEIRGKERVEGVTIMQVDANRLPIPGTERDISCDTLMISAGLIPENELTEQAGIPMSEITKGAVVNDKLETAIPGFFACGNVLHVHDLVDFVSEEAEVAGKNAADYLRGLVTPSEQVITVRNGTGAGGVVPHRFSITDTDENVTFMFRPVKKYQDVRIVVCADDREIFARKAIALTPGEMIRLDIPMPLMKQSCRDVLLISIQEGGQA